jgi:hypothetical protein
VTIESGSLFRYKAKGARLRDFPDFSEMDPLKSDVILCFLQAAALPSLKEIFMTHTDLAKMPVSEKIQLMESLWESLSNDAVAAAAVPAWHGDVLANRQVLLDQGEEPESTWGDAKQRIRDQTAKE